jgi:hypothetical protein
MVKPADDIVEIEPSDADLNEVLKGAGIEPNDEYRDALREALTRVQNHPGNASQGKPTVFVPGVNVHFRLLPSLYTAFVATLGAGITLATLPVNPLVAIGSGAYTAAQVIKEVGEKFHHLNAVEVAVFSALSQTVKDRQNVDSTVRDAKLEDVQAHIRDPNVRHLTEVTLEDLVRRDVVSRTPRDGDSYYSPRF